MKRKACLLLAFGLVTALAGCSCGGGGSGTGSGGASDYTGDTPPTELVGEWQSYDSTDPAFQYYDPATGKWQGNGYYSNLQFTAKGGYEQVDINQTGAGSGCASALYVDRKGGIKLSGNLLTLRRQAGQSTFQNCSTHSVNNGPFDDVTFTWTITTEGGKQVLSLGDPDDPSSNPQLYDRVR